jgi:type I restriction enzyme, S subunit
VISSRTMTLSDAYWFQEGPGLRKWQFTQEGTKVLNVGNILADGTLDLSKTSRHIANEEFRDKYQHFSVDAGDLVIASSGISFDPDGFLKTKISFVRQEHLPLCMNTSTIRFKETDGISSLSFLKHWFNSNEFRSQISQLVTGSAQFNFGPSHLKQISITLPPLPEQKRIAEILDKADELRRLRQRAIDQLNTLSQSIFHDMFGNKPEYLKVPLSTLVQVRSSLGDPKLPENCTLLHVGPEHIQANSGKIAWDRVGSCQEDGVTSGKYRFQSGDILYSKIRPYLNKVAIADRKGMCSADMYALKCNADLASAQYIHFALGSSDFLNFAEKSSGRANIPKINRNQLLGYPVPLAPLSDQKKFSKKILEVGQQYKHHQIYLGKSEALFNSLQQRAFQGAL